jgi:hypothetical protein
VWRGEHSFVLVIEGTPEAVHALMARIVLDPRHSRLMILSRTTARVRLFDTTSLKWVHGTVCRRVEDLAEEVVRLPPPLAAPLSPPADDPALPVVPSPQAEPCGNAEPTAEAGSFILPPVSIPASDAPRVARDRATLRIIAELVCAAPTQFR